MTIFPGKVSSKTTPLDMRYILDCAASIAGVDADEVIFVKRKYYGGQQVVKHRRPIMEKRRILGVE